MAVKLSSINFIILTPSDTMFNFLFASPAICGTGRPVPTLYYFISFHFMEKSRLDILSNIAFWKKVGLRITLTLGVNVINDDRI